MHDTTSPEYELLQVTAPQREFLDQVLDKWSMQVLDRLCGQPRRFNDLRRAIPEVGQKSLTATLRRLERNGMVERVIISSRPLTVEYRITPLGDTLNGLIESLLRWSSENMADVERARDRYDAED